MKVSEIMTPSPACCTQTARFSPWRGPCAIMTAARYHRAGGHVVGIVTDRDLAIRALADGKSGNAKVSDVITRDPKCCDPDDDLRVLQKVMSENQVRRVPVVNSSGRCVGIVSQADLALAARRRRRSPIVRSHSSSSASRSRHNAPTVARDNVYRMEIVADCSLARRVGFAPGPHRASSSVVRFVLSG